MASHTLGAFIEHEGPSKLQDPPSILHKSEIIRPAPSAIELDHMQWGSKYSGPSKSTDGPQTPHSATRTSYTDAQTPKTPNELESSVPPSPEGLNTADLVQTWSNPPKNRWRVLSACLVFVGNGMNDSAPGALIPYMETHYNIGYAIVSLIFVTNAVGFLTAAFITDALVSRLGRSKTFMLAEVIMITGVVMLLCTGPFGLTVAAFFFLGLAEAIGLAINNVFMANLANGTIVLGAGHGSYGIGGVLGPIIATALASHGVLWSRFYFVPLGIRLACFVCTGWSFYGQEKEASSRLLTALEQTASRRATEEAPKQSKLQQLKKAIHNRTTIMGALFIFCYQGAEVSVSGWVISFLITYRGGDPAHVGYVTAGFWGGITLGRFLVAPFAPRVGLKVSVCGLVALTIAFQIMAWFIPSVVGPAVAVCIVGFLLGPIYPCSAKVFSVALPHSIQMTSLAFISSAGSSGGAIAPFTTGLLAQAVGTWVLHPICVGLYACMIACWLMLPKIGKRTD